MININKKWLFTKKNNKKYKKQQFIKALKFSYINRKKNLNYIKKYNNINFNWLLKKYLN